MTEIVTILGSITLSVFTAAGFVAFASGRRAGKH